MGSDSRRCEGGTKKPSWPSEAGREERSVIGREFDRLTGVLRALFRPILISCHRQRGLLSRIAIQGKLMRLKILLCHLLITVVGVTQARADVSVVCTYAVITELHEELTFCEETLSSDIEARYRTIHEMLGNFIQARSEGAWRKYGPGWQQDLRSSLTRADRVEVCDHPQLNRKDTLERLLSEENMSEYRERLKRGVDPEEGGCL